MKTGIKIGIAAALALILAATAGAAAVKYNAQKKRQAQLARASAEISAVTSERNAVRNSLEKLEEEYAQTVSEGMYVTLFFENITDNLIQYAYPLLTQYGRTGTVVMQDGMAPGDEGCISPGNFRAIMNRGWDYALGGTGGAEVGAPNAPEVFAEYVDGYMARLREASLEIPKTFCFDEGEYDERYAALLKERGFNFIRLSGKEYAPQLSDGVYFIGSQRICAEETDIKEDMGVAYASNAAIAVHVRFLEDIADTTLDCGVQKYIYMLNYLEKYCGDASVLTASELYRKKIEEYDNNREYIDSFTVQSEELKARLTALEEELKGLYASLED